MGNMVASDAGIACMDSKYHYLLWRPVTAIRNADQDGNAGDDADPTWSPLLTTPNHPEYPSAHGCVTAAVTGVLASVLKTPTINIDVPGATGGGTTLTTSRHFDTAHDLLENVANARIWAGLHYRFATTAGVKSATKSANTTCRATSSRRRGSRIRSGGGHRGRRPLEHEPVVAGVDECRYVGRRVIAV